MCEMYFPKVCLWTYNAELCESPFSKCLSLDIYGFATQLLCQLMAMNYIFKMSLPFIKLNVI